jgi:uncharacterized membrane protein YvbJ
MRKCEYCGHENGDEAAQCHGCGTEFLVPTALIAKLDPTSGTELAEPRPAGMKFRRKLLLAAC